MLLETRNALNSIQDAIDLTKMVEELLNPSKEAELQKVLPGLRVTIRSMKQMMQDGHATIGRDFVNFAKEKLEEMKRQKNSLPQAKIDSTIKAGSNITPGRPGDLKSGIEKISEP